MRIFPVLDWEYADVWQFLEDDSLGYAKLYDRGYTSIGSPSDTIPNPFLLTAGGGFLAARYMKDSSKERSGRL